MSLRRLKSHTPLAACLGLLGALLPVSAWAQPLLHEFFELDDTRLVVPSGAPAVPEPVHTADGAMNPGGNHPGRPGARNAPEPSSQELSLDRDTDREGWLTYYAVFDPTVAPFKRVGVRDRVVLEHGEVRLGLQDARPRRLRLTGGEAPVGDEAFVGTVLLDLQPNLYVPIPSVSADMVVHRYQTEPTVGVDFFRDGADNLLVRAEHEGRVRLRYWVSGPSTYFAGALPAGARVDDVPPALRPEVPEPVRRTAEEARALLGLRGETSATALVTSLAQYFRSFRAEAFPPEEWTEDAYRDILFGGRGVCRHRTFAFVVTLQAWGLPARYVYNEAHTFAEAYLPGAGWRRIDLGGGAEGLSVMNAADRPLHTLPGEDPFPSPEGFADTYSQEVREALASRSVQERAGPGADGTGRSEVRASEWDPFAEAGIDLASLPEHAPYGREPAPEREPTVIDVLSTGAEGFRGERLGLSARLEDAGGRPLSGRELRVYLGPATGATEGRLLEVGRLTTDERGAAVGDVVIPHSLPLGVWGIYVVFAGDEAHAPSRSP
jgi:transglutaminase-like putative cysteine protease